MPPDMVRYFTLEKIESWMFVAAGVAAIGASIFVIKSGGAWRGMSIPLILVGLIQIVVGGTVALRTDRQVAALSALAQSDPARFTRDEDARMQAVISSFQVYKYVEIALIALGVALVLFGGHRREWLYSIGTGLILQAALMLVFDLFAEQRAHVYRDRVQAIAAERG